MMGSIWKARNISLKTKVWLFNSNVKTILLYGAETWKTTKSHTQNSKYSLTTVSGLRRFPTKSSGKRPTSPQLRKNWKGENGGG
jgi:hypothetical protein